MRSMDSSGSYFIFTLLWLGQGFCQQCTVNIETDNAISYEGEEDLPITCISMGNQCTPRQFWTKSFQTGSQDVYKFDAGFDYIAVNEYSLKDRAYGIRITDYILSLVINGSKIQDSGTWNCKNGNGALSDGFEILVRTRITKSDIEILREPQTIIGYAQAYTCKTSRVYPLFEVEWQINGSSPQAGDNSGDRKNEDNSWSMSNKLEVILVHANEARLSCTFKYPGLDDIVTESNSDNVKYVAIIEYLRPTANDTVHIDDMFRMSCVASGSNPEISWKFNDELLDEGFVETADTIDGNFEYGQTLAEQSNLTWTISEKEKTCDNMYSYNGNYQCIAKVKIGDIKTEALSDLVYISVIHIPLLKPQDSTDIVADIGDNVTLKCDIDCSNPPVTRIQWNSTNGRDGLDEFDNLHEANIIVKEEDFNVTIHCIVSNAIGNAIISYTFKMEQKTSLQHNAYENEDITLDDHADVTPYEQVNDIDYEPDHPTSYVNVNPTSYVNAKPTSYVNVKSTSYSNIDPTSYINVNAMEPSKYEQLKHKKSGNIEISTYEDLNGKAK